MQQQRAIYCDPLWLQTLADGAAVMLWVMIAAACEAAMGALPFILPMGDGVITWVLRSMPLQRALPFGEWIGIWLLTRPEPAVLEPRHYRRIRRWLRVAATAGLTPQFLNWAAVIPTSYRALSPGIIVGLTVAETILFYLHVRNVARLIPDRYVVRHAPIVMGASLAAITLTLAVPVVVRMTGRGSSAYQGALGAILSVTAAGYAVAVLLQFRRSLAAVAVAARDRIWAGWKDTAGGYRNGLVADR